METVVLVGDIKANANNTEAAFTTKLARPLILPGRWRASIMDISYPHLWNGPTQNLPYVVLMVAHGQGQSEYDANAILSNNQPLSFDETTPIRGPSVFNSPTERELIADAKNIRFLVNDPYELVIKTIDEGDNTDPKHLVKHMNSTILTMYRKLYPNASDFEDIVVYKPYNLKVKFRNLLHARYLIVAPTSKSIISMLGHKSRSTKIKTVYNREIDVLPIETLGSAVAPNRIRNKLPAITEVSSLRPLDNVFVYSDLVEQTLIGESQANLLGYFPIKSTYGEQGYWCFNPPYDYKVVKSEVDTISIKLAHINGELFPFMNGQIIIRLLFKRVQ